MRGTGAQRYNLLANVPFYTSISIEILEHKRCVLVAEFGSFEWNDCK